MTRHLPTTSSQATHNQSRSYHKINDPSGEQRNPRFISGRSDAAQIYPRRKTNKHETDFHFSSISHQPFYLLRMFERYTLSTTRFPSQSFDETGCDYFLFPTPGKKDHITIDIHYSLEHHNGIHTKEVDLLNLKELNDLPKWYPFFHLPYQIDVKVTCTGFYVYVEIIYIDSSPDPEIFSSYVYSEPSDEKIRHLYGIPSEENHISNH